MNTKADSYQAAWQLADAVVTLCLPPWFPSVGTILYLAGLGISVTYQLARTVSFLSGRGEPQ